MAPSPPKPWEKAGAAGGAAAAATAPRVGSAPGMPAGGASAPSITAPGMPAATTSPLASSNPLGSTASAGGLAGTSTLGSTALTGNSMLGGTSGAYGQQSPYGSTMGGSSMYNRGGMYGGSSYGGGYGGMGGMGGGMYGGGMGGMGGMGMGMGGMGMGQGMMGPPSASTEMLMFIFQIVGSLGQLTNLLGMNTEALTQMCGSLMNLGDRAMMFMGNQQMPYPPGHPMAGQLPPGPTEEDQKHTAARMRMLKWVGGLIGAYFAYRFIKWMFLDKHGGKTRIPETVMEEIFQIASMPDPEPMTKQGNLMNRNRRGSSMMGGFGSSDPFDDF